jgi:hypothetical protein
MIGEGLSSRFHRRVIDTEMTGGTAIYALEARQQYLIDGGRSREYRILRIGIRFLTGLEPVKLALVILPLGSRGLSNTNQQQCQIDNTEKEEEKGSLGFHQWPPAM